MMWIWIGIVYLRTWVMTAIMMGTHPIAMECTTKSPRINPNHCSNLGGHPYCVGGEAVYSCILYTCICTYAYTAIILQSSPNQDRSEKNKLDADFLNEAIQSSDTLIETAWRNRWLNLTICKLINIYIYTYDTYACISKMTLSSLYIYVYIYIYIMRF